MEILTLILTVIHLHVYNKGATGHSPTQTQQQSVGNRLMSTIRNTFNFRRRSDRNSRSTQKR